MNILCPLSPKAAAHSHLKPGESAVQSVRGLSPRKMDDAGHARSVVQPRRGWRHRGAARHTVASRDAKRPMLLALKSELKSSAAGATKGPCQARLEHHMRAVVHGEAAGALAEDGG